MKTNCPFCEMDTKRIIAENGSCLAIRDGFPVSPAHTLIIPKRHVASYFDLTNSERRDLMTLMEKCREELVAESNPDGFNVGFNDGAAAGQTVMHLHLHLIPRFEGDVPDPRGGVRWVIPEKVKYW